MAGPRRVVVVGGGVTGLTAAYRLLAPADGRFAVTLLEGRAELGGNIRTERRDGFLIDGGPDAWVVAKPQATALCKELGLGDRLLGTTVENRRLYIRQDGRLHLLPEGVLLTVPTRLRPFAETALISPKGKARAALDLVIPRRGGVADESIAAFVRRRLGGEILERIADPLMGGIYAGDVEALSIRATFPQLVEMEERHGSLIRGAARLMATRREQARAAGGEKEPSAFHALAGGTGELIGALRAALERLGAEVRVGASVASVQRPKGGVLAPPSPRWLVATAGEPRDPAPADDVILACPAFAAAAAVRGVDDELARMLDGITYLSTATIVLAYPRAAVPHPLDALGLILPASERRRILATTFISSKWAGRAPDGMALLRVFVGGHRDPRALDADDAALTSLAREELAELIGVRAEPLFARVFRFERANPQPLVGHGERVRAIRTRAQRHAGIWFCGAAYDGVGIPDCVRQASEVARAIASR